ncbi:MAG: hypothetical protein ABXS93_01030 [Sulfurimonas sp.]
MKKILLSTLAAATVLLTQVQAQSVEKDSITVEKSLKNSYNKELMKRAFIDAAAKESWVLKNDSGDTLTFEQNFSQKRKHYNQAIYRGQRKMVHENVQLTVDTSEKSFSMDLLVDKKDSKIAHKAKKSMENIHNSVYVSLAADTM